MNAGSPLSNSMRTGRSQSLQREAGHFLHSTGGTTSVSSLRQRAAIQHKADAAPPEGRQPRRPFASHRGWAPLLVLLAGVAVYANTFHVPFLLDDIDNIVNNPTIRSLGALQTVLSMPQQLNTVAGRPIQNLSLAVNYALCGLDVRGYHVVNLLIHLANALLLLHLVRRTLRLPSIPTALQQRADGIALAVALLWVVHPLNTQAVTYITQRGESQASLLYMLTLYGLLRGATSAHPHRGYALSVAACILGAGCKETLATAPFTAIVFDRLFLAPSWREIARRRPWLYAGLASCWLVLAILKSTQFNPSAGTDLPRSPQSPAPMLEHLRPRALADVEVTPWHFLLTEAEVIPHYFRLAVWPDALSFDYHWPFAQSLHDVRAGAIAMALLLAGTAWALVRVPRWGFLWLAVFFILAPSSSILPLEDPAWDYRMYLPLAAILTALVTALARASDRLGLHPGGARAYARLLPATLVALAAIALGARSLTRNHDYRSAFAIWDHAVRQNPANARALHSRGMAFAERGQLDAALADLAAARALKPDSGEILTSLGEVWARAGNLAEAEATLRVACSLPRVPANAYVAMANVLLLQRRTEEAMRYFQTALREQPTSAMVNSNLGIALCAQGRIQEALPYLSDAVRITPDNAECRNNLGRALALLGRLQEAQTHLAEAVRLKPDYTDARRNLEQVRAQLEATRPP